MIYKIINTGMSCDISSYIKSDDSPVYMEYLVAYIHYTFSEKYSGYALSPNQMSRILIKIYGYTSGAVEKTDLVLDMFDIWEKYCPAAYIIENIDYFYRDNLKKIFDECYQEIIMKRGTNMKRYRICYDKMIVAHGELKINGHLCGGLAAYLEYQVFDKSTGDEIFFTCGDDEEPSEQKVCEHYLNDFYDLAYDKDSGFTIIPAEELKNLKDCEVKYRLSMFAKSIDINDNGLYEDVSISEEQFIKILKENRESFDNADNNYAQSCGVTFNIIG